MVRRIIGHWQDGWGADYNPDRREALSIIRLAASLEEAQRDFQQDSTTPVIRVVTGARQRTDTISFSTLRERLRQPEAPHLLTLGTGWGLTDDLFDQANLVLEPIQGAGSYNHLSVRSATAIMLDRLLSTR